MEDKKRPSQDFGGLLAGIGLRDLPDFLDQRAKFFKNRKIKNTPSILISSKLFKKLPKKSKKWNFVVFWWFWWPLNSVIWQESLFENIYLRVTDGTGTGNNHYFSWGDGVLLFLGTQKTHFYVFSTPMQFCFEKTLKKHQNSIKIAKCIQIGGKIEGLKNEKN